MVIELISRNIIPVFVFDGKPPPEKKLLLDKRRKDKTEAQPEIDKLAILIKNTPENSREYHNISTRLDSLKENHARNLRRHSECEKNISALWCNVL